MAEQETIEQLIEEARTCLMKLSGRRGLGEEGVDLRYNPGCRWGMDALSDFKKDMRSILKRMANSKTV